MRKCNMLLFSQLCLVFVTCQAQDVVMGGSADLIINNEAISKYILNTIAHDVKTTEDIYQEIKKREDTFSLRQNKQEIETLEERLRRIKEIRQKIDDIRWSLLPQDRQLLTELEEELMELLSVGKVSLEIDDKVANQYPSPGYLLEQVATGRYHVPNIITIPTKEKGDDPDGKAKQQDSSREPTADNPEHQQQETVAIETPAHAASVAESSTISHSGTQDVDSKQRSLEEYRELMRHQSIDILDLIGAMNKEEEKKFLEKIKEAGLENEKIIFPYHAILRMPLAKMAKLVKINIGVIEILRSIRGARADIAKTQPREGHDNTASAIAIPTSSEKDYDADNLSRKRPRLEESVIENPHEYQQDIPFQGPSSRKAYTGGIPPVTSFGVRTIDLAEAQTILPEGRTWGHYDFGEHMGLRSAPNMTIPQWASMGFWRKNLFGLLFALGARVPDFAISAYWCDTTSEMALVIRKEGKLQVEVASGTSKTKAKQEVADKMIKSAEIWQWINTKYKNTSCDEYL